MTRERSTRFGRSLVELVFDGKAESDVRVWTIGRDVLTTQDPQRHFGL